MLLSAAVAAAAAAGAHIGLRFLAFEARAAVRAARPNARTRLAHYARASGQTIR